VSIAEATGIVASCTNEKLLKAEIDLATKTITYNLRRIRRLRQPRAAAILSRYANFVARYAFDHDFGDRDREEHSKDGVPETVAGAATTIALATPDASERLAEPASPVGAPSPEPADTPAVNPPEGGK